MDTLVSNYNKSYIKRLFNYLSSVILLLTLTPVILTLTLIIKFYNHGPVFFKQKRIGKNGKEFTIIKFRTMVINAEKLKTKYKNLNISDGPTFKIPDDPRYTKIGKFLAKTGLDELPQLVNILKGDMDLVGPRPLPLYEANKLTKSQKIREMVRPGITSGWVVKGAHNLKFSQWMLLDKEYVTNATFKEDLSIVVVTTINIIRQTLTLLRQS